MGLLDDDEAMQRYLMDDINGQIVSYTSGWRIVDTYSGT
jgi:hypothetical protein